MYVLFISSGNSKAESSPLVVSQGESLKAQSIKVDYYFIRGKGILGYLRNIRPLRKCLRKKSYDILHAHYGLAAIVALLAKKNQKLVVSFMGDDIVGSNRRDGSITSLSKKLAGLNAFLAERYYDFSIVKSKEMLDKIKGEKVSLIPNGVDISNFIPVEKHIARKLLNMEATKILIIFVANPARIEKNFHLAKKALWIVDNPKTELIPIYNINHKELVNYYNAADLLVLTSYHEGSPNVIKEAMACNCPIVATDVGDVRWVIDGTEGCKIATFEPEDFAEKLKLVLDFSQKQRRTNGRQKILELGLDSKSVARKIVDVYNKVLNL